jgi:DNA-directed RNA polymerase specialized sigma24 family protein
VFVKQVEPGLRRALVAGFGVDVGRDSTVDALAWAWQHWSRVAAMRNPGGYLYRVGQTAARRALRAHRRLSPLFGELSSDGEPMIEPALGSSLSGLTAKQRAAVLLVHGYGYSLSEAATVMGCGTSSVRNHVARALAQLRSAIGDHVES